MAARPLNQGAYWNVNIPHIVPTDEIPDRVRCESSKCPLPVAFEELPAEGTDRLLTYAGVYAEREREVGSDIDVCFGGKISVSKLSL